MRAVMGGVGGVRAPAKRRHRFDVLLLTTEFLPWAGWGGLGVYVSRLSQLLMADGLKVAAVCPLVAPLARAHRIPEEGAFVAKGGLTTFWVPVPSSVYISRASIAAFTTKAHALLDAYGARFDVIHAHEFPTFPLALRLQELHSAPLVTTFHQAQFHRRQHVRLLGFNPADLSDSELFRLEHKTVQRSNRIIAISRHMSGVLARDYGARSVADKSATVYYPAEPMPAVRGRSALRRLLGRPDEKVVLFVARPSPQKGAQALLAAANLVLRKRRDVRFVLAGGGVSADDLEPIVDREALAQFSLLGPLDRGEVARFMAVADVGVVPSLFEPFGIVAVEMLSFGLPLVYGAIEGLSEIVGALASDLGFPVPVEESEPAGPRIEPRRLATALERALALEGSTRARTAKAARARIAQVFSEASFVRAHVDAYSKSYNNTLQGV